MNLGMQAIADEIRNSTEVAPDGLEGGSADEREDVSVGTEPVGNTVIEETPPVNGAAVPEAEDSGPMIGVDQALRILKEHGGEEAANTLLEFQRGFTRAQSERSEVDRMRQELRTGLDELEKVRTQVTQQTPEQEPEPDELDKIPTEQQELLQLWLNKNGYVSQQELTARERERALREMSDTSNQRASQTWGEDFGHFDGAGKFLINPEARDKMAPVFDRIVNQKGLTFEDMFVLSSFETLMEKSKEEGRRETQNARNVRDTEMSNRLNGTGVAGRSATGASEPVLYDSENEPGNIGAVFSRIRSALAASE